MIDSLLSEEDISFRDELRAFVRDRLPDELRSKVDSGQELLKDDYVSWQRILADRGWLTATWPTGYGGTGWSVIRHYLFEEELAMAGAPPVGLTLGVGPRLAGPVICRYGNEEQKARFLPGIQRVRNWWCQGYSEPDAGSDLASLRTRAVIDGGDYVVSGAKTWSSYAHWADLMCCLARTDPGAKPQAGISFLVVDMRSPGVTVRPIRGINGRHFFNEIFLEEVRVPSSNRIGGENRGWEVAKALLEHERLGAARVAETKKLLKLAWSISKEYRLEGDLLENDPAFRRTLHQLEIDARAVEQTVVRFLGESEAGKPLGPEISMLKIRGTELYQEILDFLCDAVGLDALPEENAARSGVPEHVRRLNAHRLYARGFTIAAGSSEIQRNILAKQVLGLPA